MSESTTSAGGPRVFPATQWTVVLAAGGTPSPESAAALERLCRTYWYPLYAFVRRSGHGPVDAKDLTQEFFLRLLEHNWIGDADRCRGRFRTFLVTAVRRFLAKEWNKARALKRGGDVHFVGLEFVNAEERYCREPADTTTPEQLFERKWTLELLSAVLARVRGEYTAGGKAGLFEALEPCLVGQRETQPYAILGEKLGMTEGAVKMAVQRLRERYREVLREEIRQTVASPTELEEELRHLFRVLART